MKIVHIVKRHGQKQQFDERKVYASIYAACITAYIDKQEAEAAANLVTREVKKWIEGKKEVTSNQIFHQAAEELEHLNKNAAFMYKTHRDVS